MPAATGTRLPVVPYVVILTDAKNLQTPVRICLNRAGKSAESMRCGLRVRLGNRKHGSSSAERQKAFEQEAGHENHYIDGSFPVQVFQTSVIQKLPAQTPTNRDLRGIHFFYGVSSL